VVTGESVEYCTSSFEGREIEKLLSPAFFRGERESSISQTYHGILKRGITTIWKKSMTNLYISLDLN
jgi:hypothetical protein